MVEPTLRSEGLLAALDGAPVPRVLTLAQALARADDMLVHDPGSTRVWRTGFSPLDQHLAGGLRAGELVLVAGAQGLGKTTCALQAARNMAAAGRTVLYVCYEHPAEQLAERLLVLEA